MLNEVILMGRLTRDPELRSTTGGVDVTNFTLAVDRSYTKAGAEKETDFLDCVAWRGTAEFISRYFKKGMQVAVTGRVQTRKWKDQQEQNRVSVEIVVDEAFFADSKRDTAVDRTEPRGWQSQDVSFADLGDEDVPF